MRVQPDLGKALADADIAVLLQNHEEYKAIPRLANGTAIVDTRGPLRNHTDAHML